MEKEAKLKFQQRLELMMNHLYIGDKVYAVKFKYEGIEHVAYAFCRPGENKVIFDNWSFYRLEELYTTTGRAGEARSSEDAACNKNSDEATQLALKNINEKKYESYF
jgi:hypothetical protein